MRPIKYAKRHPLALLVLLGGGIFLVELVVMLLLGQFTSLPPLLEALADGALLVFSLAPALYGLFLRPLQSQIHRGVQMKEELLASRAEIESSHAELRLVFEQVEKAHTEWLTILDCVNDMIVLLDDQGLVRRCNRAFSLYCKRSFNELIGQSFADLLGHYDISVPRDNCDAIELCHQAQGRYYLLRTYPYRQKGNSLDYSHVVTLQDITDLKEADAELQEAALKLEHSRMQMLQKEKMASIGQLAAGVAHEINNPVGYVLSNLTSLDKYFTRMCDYTTWLQELANRGEDEVLRQMLSQRRRELKLDFMMEDVGDLMAESVEGAQRIRSIVQNLKTFSRVDEAELKPVDLNECIESTINIVWSEIKYKAELVRDLGDFPLLECYPQQLSQVFMNLLVNAAQAIEGQGSIEIRSWQQGDNVCVSVSDTGIGIEKEHIERIFEPFYTTKPVGQGTGLGLSIIYEIVQKHGGDIQVQSVPGQGTTFTLSFPMTREGTS